jgi:hypothetical protein
MTTGNSEIERRRKTGKRSEKNDEVRSRNVRTYIQDRYPLPVTLRPWDLFPIFLSKIVIHSKKQQQHLLP